MTNHQTFFTQDVPDLIRPLKADQVPAWGVMSATEMVDHILAGTQLFLSKTEMELETPEELLPKYKLFLMSDRGFKQSAKKPVEYSQYEQADPGDLEALKARFIDALAKFDTITASESDFWSFHPSFGRLDAEETRQLQFKHIRHHFQQFGLL